MPKWDENETICRLSGPFLVTRHIWEFQKITAWNYIIFEHNILLIFTVCWNWKPKILIYVKSSKSVTKLTQYICTPLKLGFNWRDASFSTSETNLDGAPNVETNVTKFAKVVQKAKKQTLFVFFNLKNNHICEKHDKITVYLK